MTMNSSFTFSPNTGTNFFAGRASARKCGASVSVAEHRARGFQPQQCLLYKWSDYPFSNHPFFNHPFSILQSSVLHDGVITFFLVVLSDQLQVRSQHLPDARHPYAVGCQNPVYTTHERPRF